MYDDTCRFLAEHFSADFASWLLGEPVTLTEIKPSELSLDPIRADAMILLQSDDSILHIEFQTLPKEEIPFRMLDYRVRGKRRYKNKTMRQVVIYLKLTTSELAYQTAYVMERTRHEFDVIRLWEQPASLFLQYPGLLPFAVLGRSADAEEALRPSHSKNGSDCRSPNPSKFNGSVRNFSWAKIGGSGNLSSSAEGHHAGISDLSVYSARSRRKSRSEKTKKKSQLIYYKRVSQSKSLPVEPGYQLKKSNSFNSR